MTAIHAVSTGQLLRGALSLGLRVGLLRAACLPCPPDPPVFLGLGVLSLLLGEGSAASRREEVRARARSSSGQADHTLLSSPHLFSHNQQHTARHTMKLIRVITFSLVLLFAFLTLSVSADQWDKDDYEVR